MQKICIITTTIEEIIASSGQQIASMEEIKATANRLGTLAENLKGILTKYGVK